ncbi:hypothetical protein [Parvularcula sp. LCG005]|uniref:hypothetical protein n=1 Tax=Parvularcula sp. LCG005 TaxID=3078805 RepID=UPI0029423DC3|nr:hypothetical protein [Parvularcula sp. LCG005]WOI54019.1 hypothetical protein RUI03_03205 [Parvularcula sp. LCG005]
MTLMPETIDHSGELSGKRIMLLEDEVLIAIDLAYAFEDAGAVAVTANSCDEALEEIEQGLPDAAVLDVNLGRGETCRPVAQKLRELGVPFFLHSGDFDRQGELINELGAKIIPKPTPAHRLVAAVVDLFDD